MKKKPVSRVKRITRSVSFHKDVLNHVKARAAELDRSVNWVLNDLVKKHLQNSAE
jgi:hypothetical protein